MLIYEGKSKKVYDLGNKELLLEFKDEVTAFDGKYKDIVREKGSLSARLSATLFEVLEKAGVNTHYICFKKDRFLKVRKYKAIPLEIIVRNYAYGSFLKRMPLVKPLKKFIKPIVEFHFKNDELHDPLLLDQDINEAGLLDYDELIRVKEIALRVNEVLSEFWNKHNLRLVDLKIEVGKDPNTNDIVVIDDLSGDSMRVLTDKGEHLDKEVYRRTRNIDLLIKGYRRLAEIAGYPTRICSS